MCPLTLVKERDWNNATCVVCKEEFRNRTRMFEHERGRFDWDEKKFKCCVWRCKKFDTAEELSAHLDEHAMDGGKE